ncbi:hypothetical protein [Mycolicibacterium pyrenivorans]|uniref:hypothetical protein n=1 Tax=Mycolicibacterium pyrenivorans TaxID=187102 RepID=UPI0021F38211|nr:hypothetical protein [Mycolicibacterium pyrenivorans]MCV7154574.1 hypothetical protein [Mycolicibacterium pyrenivorans]
MNDRILVWLSAGILAIGLSAVSIAGAGAAFADEDAGANATTSSQSPASTDDETESDAEKPGDRTESVDEATDETDATDADEEVEAPPEEPADEQAAADPEEVADEIEISDKEPGTGHEHDGAVDADELDSTADTTDSSAAPEQAQNPVPDVIDETQDAGDAGASDTPEPAAEPVVDARTAETVATSDAQPSPASARLVMTVEDEQPAPRPSLLNVVGSFFWGMFDLVTKLIDFPPAVPPGSTVTAGRSRLEIDCGDGYTADADWYFPTEGEPDKFIYFQHGFLARANFFNVTLQELAERNNAVVVAPSITSNIFACDACAMSGEPMQAAVARLFEGDRAALLASAQAAGYEGTLPEQFVITGQSAGAQLAVAASGYYYQFAPADEKADMVGVIVYDVSATGSASTGNALANALDKLPASVPVLNIAAEPNMLNSRGNANTAYAEKRPGQFNGIQLVGGAHSDAYQSDVLFGIPQLIVRLVFGASDPENVEAVQVLTRGWLTDMYAGRVYDPATRTGIYGDPGDPGEVVVDIPTDVGPARGYVLPATTPELSPFDRLINAVFSVINANIYGRCAVDPDESSNVQSGLVCSL